MYGKLFTQMYDGTLATKGPWQALATFQQLVILADKYGVVDMTADAIARRTTFPLEIIEMGIKALEQPDPGSRSSDLEGRRIVRLADHRDWGWRIVNYVHYRNMRSQEERREYMRKYQREYRSRKPDVNNVSNVNQSSKQYAVSKRTTPTPSASLPADLPVEEGLWNQFKDNRRVLKAPVTPHAERLLVARLRKLIAAGGDGKLIVEQSIERGWKGLFAIEGNGKDSHGGAWWSTDAGTIKRGKEHNLSPRPGETMAQFRDRVSTAEG